MTVRCALLVTDIVDSTRLTERLGDESAARRWTAHDRLAGDARALQQVERRPGEAGMMVAFFEDRERDP